VEVQGAVSSKEASGGRQQQQQRQQWQQQMTVCHSEGVLYCELHFFFCYVGLLPLCKLWERGCSIKCVAVFGGIIQRCTDFVCLAGVCQL
jgi:hypothetical protein